MPKSQPELSPIARTGILVGAVALIPMLVVFAHFRDDTVVVAQARAEKVATQEEQYRQMMYDELDSRLGNRLDR